MTPRTMNDTSTSRALAATLGLHQVGFYLVDLERFAANCATLLASFRRRWPRTQLAYSYKTNYTPAICARADAEGYWSEVVSGMEFELTRRLGVPGERVLFNGPAKRDDALLTALDAGATVHVDHLEEVAAVARLSPRGTRPWRVVLRCHPDHEAFGASRFGLSPSAGELDEALRALRAIERVRVVGLHGHVCPPRRAADLYGRFARALGALALEHLRPDELETLNIGGGFYSPMPPEMAAQWDFDIPTFEEYGDAVSAGMIDAFGGSGRTPLLVIEPGIAVVADAMSFVCEVVALKRLAGRDVAIVSGSVYDVKPSKAHNNLPLRVIAGASPRDPRPGTWDLTGFTCMEDDVMHRGWQGALAVGDLCVFENAGAYSNVLRPPFIKPGAPMYAREPDGTPGELLRRPLDADDVFSAYAFP
jgi:diaminopimelate decarboxylase